MHHLVTYLATESERDKRGVIEVSALTTDVHVSIDTHCHTGEGFAPQFFLLH